MNLPTLLVVLRSCRRAARDTHHDRPAIVSTNAKSEAVLEQARKLAREGREDQGAVTELRLSAGSRRKTLRQAEKASRFMGYHHELSHANLTNRLLNAALGGEAAPPSPTDRDRAQIEAIESLERLSRDQRWVRLTQLRPALLELAADVRDGRFGEIASRDYDFLKDRTSIQESPEGELRRVVSVSSSGPEPTEEEVRQLREQGRGRGELMTRLKALVGPDCGDDDPLLASQCAIDIANVCLLEPSLRKPPAPT